MDILRTLVDDLYNYRDRFFDFNDVEEAIHKPARIQKKMQETLDDLEKADTAFKSSANHMMLHGKTLNVVGTYNPLAEEILCKAVKLDPTLTDAWASLGECYWMKGDIQSAQNCFLSAVTNKKDKVSLRNLSMITRSLGKTAEERRENVKCSFEMAKEAVQMDPSDGQSWIILGNAYVAMYFSTKQDPSLMKQALSAFSQAEKDQSSVNNYDLHFNKGIIYEYLENFSEALKSYSTAKALDPMFSEVIEKEKRLFHYLQKYSTLVNTSGGLKKKRVKLLIKMIDDKISTSTFGEELHIKSLEDLSSGENPKAIYSGRVVGSLNVEDPVCSTFVLIDKSGNCAGVTLYNASKSWGVNIGDSVLIVRPNLRVQNFSYHGVDFNFKSIRVESPLLLTVNGRLPSNDALAPTIMIQSMQKA